MKAFGGIRNVYYTNSDGILICERLSTMSETYDSKGTRSIQKYRFGSSGLYNEVK